MSKMVNLFFLSRTQIQHVLSQSLTLSKEDGLIKIKLDQNNLWKYLYKTVPRVIRDDYFSAPLKVNLVEKVQEIELLKD